MDMLSAPILAGLGGNFVKKMMELSTTVSFKEKDVLFNQGDTATHFYILVRGRMALGVGDPLHTTYVAHAEGEAIGWSSLTGSRNYTASCVCIKPTTLLKLERKKLKALLELDPAVELQFYRNLSKTLENRLLQSFELLSSLAAASGTTSLKNGQIYDPFELL